MHFDEAHFQLHHVLFKGYRLQTWNLHESPLTALWVCWSQEIKEGFMQTMDHSGEGHFCQSILMSHCSTTVSSCFSSYSICMYLFPRFFVFLISHLLMQQVCAYLLLLNMPLQPVRKEFMVWWMKSPDSWGVWIPTHNQSHFWSWIDRFSVLKAAKVAKIIDWV